MPTTSNIFHYLECCKIKNYGYDFVNAGGIHIEPIGIYSKKYKKLKRPSKGSTINYE